MARNRLALAETRVQIELAAELEVDSSPKLMRAVHRFLAAAAVSGIRVKVIAKDWRYIEVELRLSWWNRNAVGTMFGGSLYAMTDPFYPLMLQQNLGPGYLVWDKSAQIEFISPGGTSPARLLSCQLKRSRKYVQLPRTGEVAAGVSGDSR